MKKWILLLNLLGPCFLQAETRQSVVTSGIGFNEEEARSEATKKAELLCNGSVGILGRWSLRYIQPYQGCPSPYDVTESCVEQVEAKARFLCF